MYLSDLEAVLENEGQCYEQPWPAWAFRLGLRRGLSCWVLESDGTLYGHGVMGLSRGWAHIMNICVAVAYRRRGFGHRLLQHLLYVAANHGIHNAWLEVRPDNASAIKLYRRMGFEKMGIRKAYYRHGTERQDALIMVAHI